MSLNINVNGNSTWYGNTNTSKWNSQRSLIAKLFQNTSVSGSKKKNSVAAIYEKGTIVDTGIYAKGKVSYNKCSAEEVLERINQIAQDGYTYWVEGDTFHLDDGNMTCSVKELKAALGTGKELKVTDNQVTFENNSYYKFTDGSGEEHKVVSCAGALKTCDGSWDKEAADYVNFWNWVAADNPTFINLEYSTDEIRNRLAEAGVEPGFFTISIGGKETTQFLSEGKNAVALYSKAQYDEYYYVDIMGGHMTRGFETGSVFKIDGKEYVVDENGKIDVPYGVDIWDVTYPPTSCEKKRTNGDCK